MAATDGDLMGRLRQSVLRARVLRAVNNRFHAAGGWIGHAPRPSDCAACEAAADAAMSAFNEAFNEGAGDDGGS